MQSTAKILTLPSVVDEESIQSIFERQRAKALELRQSNAEQRAEKIRRLRDALLERREAVHAACYADFRKPEPEVDMAEIMPVVSEANSAISSVRSWMRPVPVRPTLAMFGTKAQIRYEPMGANLIIAPWNYPVNLALSPLVSAIAGGNTAIIKPSEMTPHASAFLRELIADVFDEDEVTVVEGDAGVSKALLALPFDHIFFTGSPAVGKIVMEAAAKHLTKVTLELGGKSPVIVDKSANIPHTAKSLAFGKWTNNGQTCIAPDYVYVHEDVKESLLTELRKVITKSYGETPEARKSTPDYARIVNERHHGRVRALLDDAVSRGAVVEAGGEVANGGENYIAPTLLTNIDKSGKIMEEEIFGPLLPILTFGDVQEAIDHVNANPKPLALYVYAKDRTVIDRVLENTSAGDSCINASVIHYLHGNLPFGGVNNSGIGKAHGIFGFRAFSHERSIVEDKFSAGLMMAPPYTNFVKTMIRGALRFFA